MRWRLSEQVLREEAELDQAGAKNGEALMLHIRQVSLVGTQRSFSLLCNHGSFKHSAFAAILGDGSVASWGSR